MRFDLKSLQKYVQLNVSADKLADLYTRAGLEVEEISGDILDVAIPPNRADCLGFKGLAREAAALNKEVFEDVAIESAPEGIKDTIDLQVLDSAACPKYLGRIVTGVDNNVSTPGYIKEALEVAGITCISPVVDITNYVMLETGQPLHAFAKNRVEGGIRVRTAKRGEKITLLDSSFRELQTDTLVIADKNQVLAVAGVMGGADSGIVPSTADIILECAYFNPVAIRLTARKLGIQTDSSYRFERCIDPAMQLDVMEYVTNLILETVGGRAGPIVVSEDHNHLPQPVEIHLRKQRIEKVLGTEFDGAECADILRSLGMDVRPAADQEDLTVGVPTFRQDVNREIDLIEEIARIYGYNEIPDTPTTGSLNFKSQPEANILEKRILSCMCDRGYHEAITYSFIDSDLAKNFEESLSDAWVLTNPISNDMDLMRPGLMPGLVQAAVRNINRQQKRVRLFEVGLKFIGGRDDLQQLKTIAGVCSGTYLPEGWGNGERIVDFYDLKQDIIALFDLSMRGNSLQFIPSTSVALRPGQSADIIFAESKIGVVGALHPAIQKALDIEQTIYLFELDYNVLCEGEVAVFNNFSKYPAVRRDLALLVDYDLQVSILEDSIRKQIGPLLTDLVIFDVYSGKGIRDGQKSLGLGLTLQDSEKTLEEKDVNDVFNRLVATLENNFGAVLR